MIDREAVRDTAKYLRQVRPIDPEELVDYVGGRPHPAVVREVLREEAFDLGLAERADGTFVPAPDEPAPQPGWRPESFPEPYARTVEDLLVERHGANWHRGASGDRLREAIARLKTDYFHRNDVAYDAETAIAYAVYHLPDYYAAVGYVLDDLAERGRLPRTLSVLDVGAGTGGPALGLHDYLPDDAVVDYHAVEPSDAADVLDRLLAETGRNFRSTVHRVTAASFDPDGDAAPDDGFDVVLLANVLSELDEPAAVAERYLDAVAADGSFVAIAPADRNASIELRRIERALAPPDADAAVYAPTLRLWPAAAPTDLGWSFDRRPDVAPPAFQRRLDEGGEAAAAGGTDGASGRVPGDGTFINRTVQFSYAILRPDGRRRTPVRASPDRHARMAETERHVTNRIDLLAVKLSRDLTDDADANPVFRVGDGSQSVDHYAVSTTDDSLNRALLTADYGDVLGFENVLCLWNDDEGAYNLVVDGETVVERVA